MKTALVTGAAGFLGSHLCENLLASGYHVIGLDNFCTGLRSNQTLLEELPSAKSHFIFIEADVTQDWTQWQQQLPTNVSTNWIEHLKIIFHFASPASPPLYQARGLETMWVNSIGLNNCILFADKKNARVIFASTSEVYGDPNISPQPESYWGNVNSFGERSCYDEAKRFGESLIFTHNKKFSTQHGLVRIFNTYGPRMNPTDGRVVINFLVQALENKALTIYGDGAQTRSFCYVDDLIAGILQYAHSSLTEPINIGNPNEFTITELAQLIKKIFVDKEKRPLEIQYFPLPKDDPRQRRPDIAKALKYLKPWAPSVNLHDGLLKMIEWLKTQIK